MHTCEGEIVCKLINEKVTTQTPVNRIFAYISTLVGPMASYMLLAIAGLPSISITCMHSRLAQ